MSGEFGSKPKEEQQTVTLLLGKGICCSSLDTKSLLFSVNPLPSINTITDDDASVHSSMTNSFTQLQRVSLSLFIQLV